MKTIDGNTVIYSFKPEMPFIEKVQLGETFKIKTNDCFLGQIKSEADVFENIDHDQLNPATGPIFIEGAQEGDLLKVEIIDIKLNSQGVTLLIPGEGVLGDQVKTPATRVIPIANGCAQFRELSLPIRPMIGVIGVAPAAADGECPTDTPWKHGGNMDTADITAGTKLFLPVKQEGALFALGDCHALMGEGEVCVTGCEIGAEVMLKMDVIKAKDITWPLLETDEHTMVIVSGDTLEDAVKTATDQAVIHLQNGLGVSWEDAYMLASLVVDFRISQVVNPTKTVRAVIPKSLLQTEHLIKAIK
ncbi:MAG: acetamidase/formamidase family protein [Smithella sp.]|nr:acetamidase/formamidase family protein [Smithella sp.]